MRAEPWQIAQNISVFWTSLFSAFTFFLFVYDQSKFNHYKSFRSLIIVITIQNVSFFHIPTHTYTNVNYYYNCFCCYYVLFIYLRKVRNRAQPLLYIRILQFHFAICTCVNVTLTVTNTHFHPTNIKQWICAQSWSKLLHNFSMSIIVNNKQFRLVRSFLK